MTDLDYLACWIAYFNSFPTPSEAGDGKIAGFEKLSWEERIQKIIEYKTGACGHRTAALKYILQRDPGMMKGKNYELEIKRKRDFHDLLIFKYKEFNHKERAPIHFNIIANKKHSYGEAYINGIPRICELGGYPADYTNEVSFDKLPRAHPLPVKDPPLKQPSPFTNRRPLPRFGIRQREPKTPENIITWLTNYKNSGIISHTMRNKDNRNLFPNYSIDADSRKGLMQFNANYWSC